MKSRHGRDEFNLAFKHDAPTKARTSCISKRQFKHADEASLGKKPSAQQDLVPYWNKAPDSCFRHQILHNLEDRGLECLALLTNSRALKEPCFVSRKLSLIASLREVRSYAPAQEVCPCTKTWGCQLMIADEKVAMEADRLIRMPTIHSCAL
jgi:hypothetical protein